MPRTRLKFLLVLTLFFVIVAALPLILIHPPDQPPEAPAPDDPPTTGFVLYTLIEPGLYVGAQTESPPPGVTAVLNLSQAKDQYIAPIYKWSPIPDAAPAPSLEWLREQVAFVDAQRRAGHDVFVHCEFGISRSPMVVAAYLMWRNHWPRDHALDSLRAARPVVNPNPAFMDLLHDWEQTLAPVSTEN